MTTLRERLAKAQFEAEGTFSRIPQTWEDISDVYRNQRLRWADDVIATLGLKQIGWRNSAGRMCYGHEYHHPLDGIDWCQPVYIMTSEAQT